ncbi:hypothetical protein QR685DRAFT_544801 [Neurospora intermedia]|uniref:Uncharacterized protein n=1 Tax=Neurospora intermedia TaxID=5142 RepID=A0ABR3DF36_NEUIN
MSGIWHIAVKILAFQLVRWRIWAYSHQNWVFSTALQQPRTQPKMVREPTETFAFWPCLDPVRHGTSLSGACEGDPGFWAEVALCTRMLDTSFRLPGCQQNLDMPRSTTLQTLLLTLSFRCESTSESERNSLEPSTTQTQAGLANADSDRLSIESISCVRAVIENHQCDIVPDLRKLLFETGRSPSTSTSKHRFNQADDSARQSL